MTKQMHILNSDGSYAIDAYTIVLSTRAMKHHKQINNVKYDSIVYKANMNAADELSFEVCKVLDGRTEELWDKIVDLKLVYVPELGEYFQIKVDINDGEEIKKTVTCTSLCEAELSQVNLNDVEINTEADIDRDAYVITKFYDDKNHKASLLHRVLQKAKHYKIGHVDETLWNIQRSFSINGTSIYDFLTGDCAEQFNCLFLFDSMTRTINVYDLYTTCRDCGHRGDYTDICPKCGSKNLKYYGEDTTVNISKENLTDQITYTTNVDEIKNCFRLVAGDDDMTAAVININPNGSQYIYYISDEQKEDMSKELVDKLGEYDKLYDSYTDEYQKLTEDLYNATDKVYYYEHGMMPGSPSDDDGDNNNNSKSIAKEEADRLTVNNLSPIALSTVHDKTSVSVVDSAIKNYARVYVRTGYVKLEIAESTFTYGGKNDGYGNAYGTWVGKIKVTNYSDKEDIAYTDAMTIKVTDDYETFLKEKVMKDMLGDDDDGSLYDVLSINDLTKFKDALTYYCLARLTSFHDALQTALDTLQKLDQAKPEALFYKEFYVKYKDKLDACEDEMNKRKKTVDEWLDKCNDLLTRKEEIQKILNMENYLGELYSEFCSYRRESEYNNSNFVSDGLDKDNADIIKKAKEFFEVAKKELYKSATRQHSITASLDNLWTNPNFEPLKDKFALGNWLRCTVDDDVNRLRLISYQVTYSDLNKINIEFSDVTRSFDGYNDVRNIISSAQSMATTYSYVSKQASKGEEANGELVNIIKNGLNSANIRIKNNDREEVTYTKHGILCRSYDDINNKFEDEQLKLTHNIIAFSNDNWKTSKEAIGKINYVLDGKSYDRYGVIADTLISGVMISGDIYSLNYSSANKKGTHFDLQDGSFSLADGKIEYDSKTNKVNLKDVTLDWNTSTAPSIDNINGLQDNLDSIGGKADDAYGMAQSGVASVDVEYYLSTSTTSLSGGSWSTNAPEWVDGKYMWSRTKTSYKSGNSIYSNPVCIAGAKGKDGIQGVDGKGIKSIQEQYYLSTSSTTQSGGSWGVNMPTWKSGCYIWTRSHITWSDDTVSDTIPCLANAINGANSTASSANTTANTANNTANAANSTASEANTTATNAANDLRTLAKALGNTTITETMVFSPTIKGGQIEIISKDKTTSAKIDNNGKLTATGANISGSVNITGGSLTVKDKSNKVLFDANIDNKTLKIGEFTVQNNTSNNALELFCSHSGIPDYMSNPMAYNDGMHVMNNGLVINLNDFQDTLDPSIYHNAYSRINESIIENYYGTRKTINGNIQSNVVYTKIEKGTLTTNSIKIADLNEFPYIELFTKKEEYSTKSYLRVGASDDNSISLIGGGGTNVLRFAGDETMMEWAYEGESGELKTVPFLGFSADGRGNADTVINATGLLQIQGLQGIQIRGWASAHQYYGVVIESTTKFDSTVYNSSGGGVFTSDKSKKHNINSLNILDAANFIYSLNPVEYKFNNGTSDRFHHGLIAQEVKESMGDKDWGLYVDVNPEEEGNKGLRYDELIADIIATVQSQNERIKLLESNK